MYFIIGGWELFSFVFKRIVTNNRVLSDLRLPDSFVRFKLSIWLYFFQVSIHQSLKIIFLNHSCQSE